MQGRLEEHPLAELIREIAEATLPGALRLAHEAAKVVLYFEEGRVVYAVSNLRAYRMMECLRRWRVVSEPQLAAVGEQASDIKLLHALGAKGALGRQAADELLVRQASEILRPALLWTSGAWSFDPRVRLTEEINGRVSMGQLLMEGTRRLPADYAASRFRDEGELISPVESTPENLVLQPMEAFVLSRVDAPLSVSELKAVSGLPETETLRALYTLTLSGFLHRGSWPRAFTEQMMQRAQAIKAQMQQQAEAAKVASGARGEASEDEKGKAEASVKTQKTAAEVKPERDERRELEELFARLKDATDYYQVLGVSRAADLSEIKRTYHSLAKRFHPDRFHQDQPLRLRIEDAFARIAQAYETLKDKRSRATYDYKLDGR